MSICIVNRNRQVYFIKERNILSNTQMPRKFLEIGKHVIKNVLIHYNAIVMIVFFCIFKFSSATRMHNLKSAKVIYPNDMTQLIAYNWTKLFILPLVTRLNKFQNYL